MSGHSKWASIKHKKGTADAKRGKVFSKLAKAITVAVRDGGADLSANFTLRLAVDKAKQVNMPKDNIERAISRGAGAGAEGKLDSVLYEAIGPGGVLMLIEALTDNKNRSLTNIKTIANRHNVNLEAKVLWQFSRKGVVRVEAVDSISDQEEFELRLIEAGAEDIDWQDGLVVVAEIKDLQSVEKVISSAGLQVSSAELEYLAQDKAELSAEDGEKLMEIIELLDDDDDVSNVFTNAD